MSKPALIHGRSSCPCSPTCALLYAPAAFNRVSDHAACPWRLYYTRYYTAAAISTSQPAETPIRRVWVCHSTPDR